MNMFIFCRVEGGHFVGTQKKELNDSFTVVYLFYCTGSFTRCQVSKSDYSRSIDGIG